MGILFSRSSLTKIRLSLKRCIYKCRCRIIRLSPSLALAKRKFRCTLYSMSYKKRIGSKETIATLLIALL